MDTDRRSQPGPASGVERVIADFQARTLAGMPGRFCRLIYLASLRDHNTGRYHHHGLERRYGAAAAEEALRQCHLTVFNELMALTLRAQTEDLISHFKSLQEERPRLVEAWERLRAYQVLPPEDCHPLARNLFNNNIEAMVKILRQTELWDLFDEPHGNSDNLP